ncbi:MAG TPA: TetR/AcrR family transcriptional regulator [Planctomycetota bacterium]|nr:TetR/AcrR family transcriptional regulator [Planctomycetota bacterium]
MQSPETRDTKARLLDAAEASFGEHGFQGSSLRAITSAAEANLAAVHYHFGSKEQLFAAVFARRIEPINARRLERLDALEAAAGGAAVEVEALLAAFIEPACNAFAQIEDRGARFLQLSGRMFSEPGEHWTAVRALLEEPLARFLAAFGKSLPHLPPREVLWRLFFVVGGMCHAFSAGAMLTEFSDGACRGDDARQSVPRLIGFLAAGMRSAEVTP